MPVVPFTELMTDAQQGGYAVGYFETWSVESLQAVADAAEATRSPVILGFGGIYWPSLNCPTKEDLGVYAAMGLAACRHATVPTCLIFNESAHEDWVAEAVDLGFGVVMFADDSLGFEHERECIVRVVRRAHESSVAVEAELASPPGLGADLTEAPDDLRMTDVASARAFVDHTGIDALAVNVGQVHLHGRAQVQLNLPRVSELRDAVSVPLVLHGASSIRRDDMAEAIRLGICKVNVGSVLKRTYFDALRTACADVPEDYNPYDVVGSGLDADVLSLGRVALQKEVETLMRLFGSAGKAP